MKTSSIKSAILAILVALSISDAVAADSMVPQQGRYWSWTAPANWRHSESIAGVTIVSPDGRYTAALVGLMRSPGQNAPQAFLARALGMAYQNVKITQLRNLPRQQIGFQTWDWVEAEVTAAQKTAASSRDRGKAVSRTITTSTIRWSSAIGRPPPTTTRRDRGSNRLPQASS